MYIYWGKYNVAVAGYNCACFCCAAVIPPEDLTCALFLVLTDENARDRFPCGIFLNSFEDHALNADMFSQRFAGGQYDSAVSGWVQPHVVCAL